jgi:hypothetical protein
MQIALFSIHGVDGLLGSVGDDASEKDLGAVG